VKEIPSWDAESSSASQQKLRILWKSDIHCRIHNSPPPVPILSHINPIHPFSSYLFKILKLCSHLRLGLPRVLFPSGFQVPTWRTYSYDKATHQKKKNVLNICHCDVFKHLLILSVLEHWFMSYDAVNNQNHIASKVTIIWKGSERKQSWLNRVFIPAFG